MNDKIEESILQMAEAHLLNVQREVLKLEGKKSEIDSEIEKLRKYLTQSIEDVNIARSEQEQEQEPLNTPAAF